MELTFTDTQERFYILDGQSLHAEPGKTYELDADPGDGRWSVGAAPVVSSQSAQSAPTVSTETVPEAESEPSSEQGA